MRIVKHTFKHAMEYALEGIASLEKILFFDIETTGFTAKSSSVYLIGCAYFDGQSFQMIQWFAESPEDEVNIIREFFEFTKSYTHIIHFNGNNFDIPYLQQKCMMHQLPCSFQHLQGIDLYKRISPYKQILKLPNCKQKTIELFLNIQSKDTYGGGDLIRVYQNYLKNPEETTLQILLLHNSDDIKGLIKILPILSYYDLFHSPMKAKKVQANTYRDYSGRERQDLMIRLSLSTYLPKPIKFHANSCYFQGEGKTAQIRVPIYTEELKYYYANYKDYYYLPNEDMAIHKSVSSYVDKRLKTKATAETCYTRKYSSYLPQWNVLIQPFFKRDYHDKQLFFELTDDMKTSREIFSRYGEHVLHMLASNI